MIRKFVSTMSDSKDSESAFDISGSGCAAKDGEGLSEWVIEGAMFACNNSVADEDVLEDRSACRMEGRLGL
jgi:hypothetical protein